MCSSQFHHINQLINQIQPVDVSNLPLFLHGGDVAHGVNNSNVKAVGILSDICTVAVDFITPTG
jgi:hypothetical protein